MTDKKTSNKPRRVGDGTPGPGRPKGSQNKTTALLKDAILKAAQEAGGGGKDGITAYLTVQARENPGPFMTLLGKVLPTEVTGKGGEPIQFGAVVLAPLQADDSADD